MKKLSWIDLNSVEQVNEIKERSKTVPQVIFKHSIRCGTSALAKNRLENKDISMPIDFYYLDVISNRAVSNKVAELFDIYHESPQVLLIKDGKCVYDESHIGIRLEDIMRKVA